MSSDSTLRKQEMVSVLYFEAIILEILERRFGVF